MPISTIAERLKDHPPVKLYRIGEVARFSGLSRQTVHNYTIMGLISESDWSDGGHRLYHETVFERLALIDDLKRTKTLRDIRRIMDQQNVTESAAQLESLPASKSG